MDWVLDEIRAIASGKGSRHDRARRIAAGIKNLGDYRWVGVYDVGVELVSIIAFCGPGAPAHPTFPVTQGLTATAISQKLPVMVNDVSIDSRYLTAFGSTRSELIIPVLAPKDGSVIGTIDVESEHTNAFSQRDQDMLAKCAHAALPLWFTD
jgi:putative methionine-R-sulfoxide reductase with GAF domain